MEVEMCWSAKFNSKLKCEDFEMQIWNASWIANQKYEFETQIVNTICEMQIWNANFNCGFEIQIWK